MLGLKRALPSGEIAKVFDRHPFHPDGREALRHPQRRMIISGEICAGGSGPFRLFRVEPAY